MIRFTREHTRKGAVQGPHRYGKRSHGGARCNAMHPREGIEAGIDVSQVDHMVSGGSHGIGQRTGSVSSTMLIEHVMLGPEPGVRRNGNQKQAARAQSGRDMLQRGDVVIHVLQYVLAVLS